MSIGQLEHLADRQAIWSQTANKCKRAVDRARYTTFVFSAGGALAAALSTQIEAIRTPLGIVGALLLAAASYLTARFLNAAILSRHVKARTASERLKKLGYLFAAKAQPFSDPDTRLTTLTELHDVVEDEMGDLNRYEVSAAGSGSCPRDYLTRQHYIDLRIEGQLKYYRARACEYERKSAWLHRIEWILALLAALATAVSAQIDSTLFDLAAIAAVLTTIAGAVLAHLQYSKLDEQISSFRATERRLERLKKRITADDELPTIAKNVEEIIENETGSWALNWSN